MLSLLLLACSEEPIDSGVPADSADPVVDCFTLSPASLDFGALSVLDGESASEAITLTNTCDVEVPLHSVALEGDTNVFSTAPITGGALAAGVSLDFTVQFAPQASGEHTAQLVVESEQDTLSADLTGEGIAPQVAVTPAEVSFGEVSAGCTSWQSVTITNSGQGTLIIDSLDLSSETGTFDLDINEAKNGPLPWSLADQEEVAVEIGFTPAAVGFDSAALVITSNDPGTPEAHVQSEGQNSKFEEQIDTFIQQGTLEADILFAIDKSCSMGDSTDELSEHFGAFTDALDAGDIDYRVALIVQDAGTVYGVNPYIDSSNAKNAADITDEMISGVEGAYTEKAFTLLQFGVTQSSWIRSSAQLHLIGFSDEPEQSTYSYSYYVGYFQALKADPSDVVMHAIGGDYPGGCANAEPYTDFYQATVETGGGFESICTKDWDETLRNIGEHMEPDRSSFALSQPVLPETITVLVDEKSASGWQYDPDSHAVVFDEGHIPDGGAEISISYLLESDCP